MEKALDLRIQKTHKALIDAFLQLLTEKRFEQITVNELCNAAMVRRATFYKHFADKYEFFSFLVRYIREESHTSPLPQKTKEPGIAPYIDIVISALDFLDENEALVHSVMDSSVYPILLDLIAEQLALDVKAQLRADEKHGKTLLLSHDLMAQAFTGALIHIARWWVTHKNQVSKEEIVTQITKVFETLYAASE